MSQKNREGKRSARERLRADRERERAAQKRLRMFKVLGAAVVVLGVAAGAGLFAAGRDGGGASEGSAAEAITAGPARAPATLTIYEDFRCPGCGQFEDSAGETIRALEDEGKLTTEYHLVTIIDGNIGGDGSKFAANAAACARDEGLFSDYHDVLFQNQPQEAKDTFGDKDYLIELAGQVDGLDTSTFRSCVQDGTHDDWVSQSNADFTSSEYQATPTVLLNGENIFGDPADPLTPDRLRERVEEQAGASE